MDINKLVKLLKKEENPKLDFKLQLNFKIESDKKELTKDVIAIANSKGGRGYIIFGIEDKTKKVVGIDRNFASEESIQQAVNNRCYPPIPIKVELLNYKSKLVAVITIYKSDLKPHQMLSNGSFYLRRGSTTDVACREEIATMLQENGLFSYEQVLLHKVSINQLDIKLIKKYFTYDYMLLESLGIIGETEEGYHPTIGGLILFGRRPQLFLPHVYIRITYKRVSRIFTGNLLEMLLKVETYLFNICNNKNYPIQGLFETIYNAVIHRDYLDMSRGITVDITPKNIIVVNPGSLISGNRKIKNIVNPRRRNPWLYQRALMIDERNRFSKYGLGIDKIRNSYSNKNTVKFINIDTKNIFKVVLPPF